MSPSVVLTSGEYSLRFDELYARLWDLADEVGDGTRLYSSDGDAAIKWVIAELSGTPAVKGRTVGDNNRLRKLVFAKLVEEGWADRIHERQFRLLVAPAGAADPSGAGAAPVPLDDPDDHGTIVDDVPTSAVSDAAGELTLGGVAWSDWVPLPQAARQATRCPGVYVARVEGEIVYVGMAGERRGQGVRGRLSIYARGRGAVSGLGEAVLDRALADPAWVAARLELLKRVGAARAKEWAAEAFERQPLAVAWTACESADAARELERELLIELADSDLWNRARPGR